MTSPAQFEAYIVGLKEEAKRENDRADVARSAYKAQIEVMSKVSVQANKALSAYEKDPTLDNHSAFVAALAAKKTEQAKLTTLGEARDTAFKDQPAGTELRAIEALRKAAKHLFDVCDTPPAFAITGYLGYTEKTPFATK